MKNWPEQLYRLMPAVHQIRDAEQSESLRLLLHVIGEQVQDVQDDIDSLYENWFIETCHDWVVPYLGDLVGFQTAGDAGNPGDTTTARGQLLNRFLFPRREIANAVRRRRRKGTLTVLEDLATDITQWPSRAVEFSQSVAYFQSVRHPEPTKGGTARLIDHRPHSAGPSHVQFTNSFVDTAFNVTPHTVDIRSIRSLPGVGWFHPNKIGLFVWRRPIFSATRFPPCRICYSDGLHTPAYTFDRLGRQLPLWINRKLETQESSIASPENLPLRMTRALLCDKDGLASTDYYGLDETKSLSISAVWNEGGDWELVPASQVHVCDLRNPCDWFPIALKLPEKHVAVDPEIGLFLVGSNEKCACSLRVSSYYAFGDKLGGGEYERRVPQYRGLRTVRVGTPKSPTTCGTRDLFDEVSLLTKAQTAHNRPSLVGTLNDILSPREIDVRISATGELIKKQVGWKLNESLCIEITTNDTFTINACDILEIAPNITLEIRSARGTWPLLCIEADGAHICRQPWIVRLGKGSRLILGGLQIMGETLKLEESSPNESSAPQPTSDSASCPPCSCDSSAPVNASSTSAEVIIRHTTFVPHSRRKGHRHEACHASLTVRLRDARIHIERSILGTINLDHPQCRGRTGASGNCDCPLDPIQVQIADSIVDAASGLPAIYSNCCTPAHADLVVERSTIFGSVCVQQITRAENSLFAGMIRVQRRSVGYMRFCYVPREPNEIPWLMESAQDGDHGRECRHISQGIPTLARTPQRFKCLPDIEGVTQTNSCTTGCGAPQTVIAKVMRSIPVFISTTYGDAGYGQLALDCPQAILRGADDESEIGAFHDLYFPQRMAALEARLQEYTPADIESAVIYADDFDFPSPTYDIFRSL